MMILDRNVKSEIQVDVDVDATVSYSSAIDISTFSEVMLSYKVKTLTGTYVQVDKVKASMENTFGGEEVTFNPEDVYTLSVIDSKATATTQTKTNFLKDIITGKYKYIKIGFISDVANNVLQVCINKYAESRPISQ